MNAEQITTIITNVLTGGGIVCFLGMWIRALKNRISEMNKTIEIQQETLEVMKTQVSETEKIGNIYKQFIDGFPSDLEKYRALHTKMKDDQIKLLEQAIEQKDEKLKETAEIELEKLTLQKRAIEDISQLREELIKTINTLDQRLTTVNLLDPQISQRLGRQNRFRFVDVITSASIEPGAWSRALVPQILSHGILPNPESNKETDLAEDEGENKSNRD